MPENEIDSEEEIGLTDEEETDDLSPFLEALEDDEPAEDTELELDEDDDDDDELSPEVMRERLKARNRTIAQRTKAVKRMQKEIDGLKENPQLSPEMLARLLSGKQDDTEESGGIDIEALKERVEEDPANMVEIMFQALQNTENKVAAVLDRRDNVLLKKATAPIDPVLRQAVDALSRKEEYKGFSEEQLETVAITMLKTNGIKRPPAGTNISGGRPKKKKVTDEVLEKKFESELDQMGMGQG